MRPKASGPGAGRARGSGGKKDRGQVSPGHCPHPRRGVSHQVRPEPPAPLGPSESQKLQRGGWTGPPPALTAPPPCSQRVRRRSAALPERRHLRAEPALRLPERLHRRALRAAPLRPRRGGRRPGLRPRARGRPTPRHPARLPAAAGAGRPPGLLSPARRTLRPGPQGPGGLGGSGAGVRGRAARRVRPELLPGATQQSPPASSRRGPWPPPPPRHCPPPPQGALCGSGSSSLRLGS